MGNPAGPYCAFPTAAMLWQIRAIRPASVPDISARNGPGTDSVLPYLTKSDRNQHASPALIKRRVAIQGNGMRRQFATVQSTFQAATSAGGNPLRQELRACLSHRISQFSNTGILFISRLFCRDDRCSHHLFSRAGSDPTDGRRILQIADSCIRQNICGAFLCRNDLARHYCQKFPMPNLSKAEWRKQAQRDRYHKPCYLFRDVPWMHRTMNGSDYVHQCEADRVF